MCHNIVLFVQRAEVVPVDKSVSVDWDATAEQHG